MDQTVWLHEAGQSSFMWLDRMASEVRTVWLQEASWCDRLIADHAVVSLEAGLRSVEIASRLLLLHDSFILLSEDKAGLLEKHVG